MGVSVSPHPKTVYCLHSCIYPTNLPDFIHQTIVPLVQEPYLLAEFPLNVGVSTCGMPNIHIDSSDASFRKVLYDNRKKYDESRWRIILIPVFHKMFAANAKYSIFPETLRNDDGRRLIDGANNYQNWLFRTFKIILILFDIVLLAYKKLNRFIFLKIVSCFSHNSYVSDVLHLSSFCPTLSTPLC